MKECRECKSPFEITNSDRQFYQKIDVPDPSMCPNCRTQRRMMFRNFFNLHHRKCSLTGKEIISMYDENAPFPVYEMREWWSDKWSGLDYGFDADFTKPVFDQLKKLHQTVPRMNIANFFCENTDYCNFSFQSRNCYLVFGSVWNEDCCYGHIVWQSKNCFDCLYTYASQFCYECVDCFQSHTLFFSVNCENCSDSRFLRNCVGCRNCFGCVGLNNKEYHIFNKPHTKSEYESKMKEFNGGDIRIIRIAQTKVNNLIKGEIVKYFHGYNCENATGDYLYNCKNVFRSFDLKNCEDCAYSATLDHFNNSYDCNFSAPPSDWCYNCLTCTGHGMMMCHSCVGSSELIYCDNCPNSKHCFGCVSLKGQEYCIFNKKYPKEEYEKLVTKLIERMTSDAQWGEFFPADFSPFAYNEAIVQEYFPLVKKETLGKDLKWHEKNEIKSYKGPKYEISDTIQNVKDDILDKILICEKTDKPYKIIPQELKFYRQFNLPIPRRCPDQRHLDRMELRNPRKLYDRNCDKCQSNIRTTYSPNRPEKVYCENCYLKNIY